MSVSVEIDALNVHLGGAPILRDVTLTVPAGSFVTLLGPSGSGKTTTLNVLAGFTEPTSGSVLLGGRPLTGVPPEKRDIGVVFQNYALFPHRTVAQNVEFPLLARKMPKGERRERVARALELVRLPEVGGRRVQSLSGGQQQRIALARALVYEPALLLLDEPLAALDKQLREAMQYELGRIQRETGTTTVAVTHDQTEALSMSDLVAIMNGGRIEQIGTPEEVYHRPATPFVAQFLGEANLLPVSDGRVEALALPVEGASDGFTVVRPEDLALIGDPDAAGAVPATVDGVVFQGPRSRVTVTVPGCAEPLVVTVPAGTEVPDEGDAVGVRYCGGGARTLSDPPPTTDPSKSPNEPVSAAPGAAL
ncbi:ABC transporter ATP-binding protein [Streptomyces himalayensis]|uniref:ABC-type quaternary amine transporter n=1 Tax=Streptomyces himalayensis subsp. himalayensis TaxID=2756131 RepID=A0A7W0DQI8_9ACTN|nr:ABC transporter ATP-binding protein [Streptomyces himalayensis]MBA2949403.1 ABC transporter ATP-binding protein [Streptomyces himalayensis subsp. himalayensis]